MVLPLVLCGGMPTPKIIMKVLNTKLHINTIAVITISNLAFQCDPELRQIKTLISTYAFANEALSAEMTQSQKMQKEEFNTMKLFSVGLKFTALETYKHYRHLL